MILYQNSANGFCDEVHRNQIVERISTQFIRRMGHDATKSEKASWNNSMQFMRTIVAESGIADDCGIMIEYNIPSTHKRIDFIVTGQNQSGASNLVVIELKQWSEAKATNKESIVEAFVGQREREVPHPSYQAWSYKQFLTNMNSAVYDGDIQVSSCAYLHNYKKTDNEPLLQSQYEELVADTPVYFKEDSEKLESYLKRTVGCGKGMGILLEIENGIIRPSKKLIDVVGDMYRGNPAFTLLDEQMVAYSNIMDIAHNAKKKTVVLVNGAPGTGKSVVAMNVFCNLLKEGQNIRYITPNAAFKESLIHSLAKQRANSKKALSLLFIGSGVYFDSSLNEVDVIVCDEAHRLKAEGTYMYKGTSQVEDMVRTAFLPVFFIDDDQQIRPNDEGSRLKIKEYARKYQADVKEVSLQSQFRCAGADGFMDWMSTVLQVKDEKEYDDWVDKGFDFRIMDNPNDLYHLIQTRNFEGNNARILAGFAWSWTSDKEGNANAEIEDVTIPEYGFSLPWNSHKGQYDWAINSEKQNQIGCVHTSQGLEFDYVGVIIGNDLIYDRNRNQLLGVYDEYKDNTGRRGLRDHPDVLSTYIKRIYRVLMSRGMKGCYVFCRNPDLAEYFKEQYQMAVKAHEESARLANSNQPKTEPLVTRDVIIPIVSAIESCTEDNIIQLPLVGRITAGYHGLAFEDIFEDIPTLRSFVNSTQQGKYFYLEVKGDSMIGVGLWEGDRVLIRSMSNPRADVHNGDIVACLIDGDHATLKSYYRDESGVWLCPENPAYQPRYVSWEEFAMHDAILIGVVKGKA